MSEWKEYRLGELIEEIAMGPFGSNIKVECFVHKGVPVLNGSNLQGFKLNESAFNYVTPEKADSLGRANAFRGDVVITHRGTLGQIIYIPEDSIYERYIISQSQFRVKFKKEIDPQFIVYFFHSRAGQHLLLTNASQVGVPAIARPSTSFKELKAILPPLSEQKKIAEILSSLDEKIETNRKINARLEELSQALFKSWFIDFEPFGGKMPEDWKRINIGTLNIEISDFVANGSFASLKENVTLYDKPEFAYFIRNTDLKVNSFPVFVDEHSYKFLSKSKLFGGEIIISNVGDVGSVFLCPTLDKPMTLGNNIIMVRPQKDCLTSFLYLFFRSYLGQHLIDGITGGSAQPKFNKTDFKRSVVILPKDDTLMKFENIIRPILTGIEHRSKESAHLAALRDTLLPKLMSGELIPE